jgi:photosystem II stability/assembly factor-like uncharacterized protein
MFSRTFSLLLLLLPVSGICQPSTENDIVTSFATRKTLAQNSILKDYPVRNIGPTVQGGRVVDIDVNAHNPKEFYVAYASGGLFKTVNNGITFDPVFDNNDALGIGDFALSKKNPDVIYLGTGEKNSSRSSYAGSGLYRSSDGGKSWKSLGLANTHHIGRVVIDPVDDNVVWVAAIGALYSNNSDRGVYKTIDGGKTWRKTLFINDSTGVIDLIANPVNSKQLYAAAWERTRKAWHFKGSGGASGVYRSDDGGETWKRISNGLPQGNDLGRIGLKMSPADANRIYAVVDCQAEVQDKKEQKKDDKIRIEDFKNMPDDIFFSLDNKKLDEFLKESNFPKKYTAEVVKRDVKEKKYTVRAISEYHGADANAKLFKTKIKGAQVYRSDDNGESWKLVNSYDLDGVFNTFGYYFAEMEVSPKNADHVYIYGVPLLKSKDGGVTWHHLDTLKGLRDVHVDHHALWINPNDTEHLLLGNDGGLYMSYDGGANWNHINNMPVGQFYTINVDMETPYNVYGGLQDNGVLRGSSKSIPNETKHWEMLMTGDGMHVAVDPRNSKLVYTGFQFGNYYRLEPDKNKSGKISPQHDIGQESFRWNWRAPFIVSKHNADILYTASHKVHRSLDRGENWEVISEDLTGGKATGNVPFGTVSALAESPVKFGLLYCGTDDGNLWVLRDGNWSLIKAGLPDGKWISSVFCSPHDEKTVFVSLNGYRRDDFHTYLFVSNDDGKNWQSVKGNLPESVANVIIQDPVNKSIYYCGLDNGTYISFDAGANWQLLNGALNVPSYDLIVHPRDNELVIATHGRSAFVVDVKPMQALGEKGLKTTVAAFNPEAINFSEKWGERDYAWSKVNSPYVDILYYAAADAAVKVEVYDEKNNLVRRWTPNVESGFHLFRWDLKIGEPITPKLVKSGNFPPPSKYVPKGKYTVKFTNGSETSDAIVEIK